MSGSLGTATLELVANPAGLEAGLLSARTATEGEMGLMGSAVGKLAGILAGAFAVDKIVQFGVSSVEAAMKFQAAMELIHTQANASQAAVNSMSQSVLQMAASVGTKPDELAIGLYHIVSQGLSGAKALDALRIAAEGAKVGQANLEDVTNALGAVLASGIKGAQNMSQAMGDLNATVGAGDMRMQDLADAMGTGLPAKAAIFGVTLRDASAALAVFGDNNIRGAAAGTLFNSTIRVMAAESAHAAKVLDTIGISQTQLADDIRSKGLIPALEDLKTHMVDAGLTASEQGALLTAAFGGRQAGGVMILLDQMDRLKTKFQEVGAGANSFGEAWAATTQTAQFHVDQFHAAMSTLEIELGAKLLPAVTSVTDELTKLIGWLTDGASVTQHLRDVMDALGISAGTQAKIIDDIKTAWSGLIAAFDAVKPVAIDVLRTAFDALKTAVTTVFDYLDAHKTLFEILAAAVGAAVVAFAAFEVAAVAASAAFAVLTVVMDANPVMLVVVALAALAAGLVVAYEKVGWFHDFVNAAWKDIQSVAQSAWPAIQAAITNALTVISADIDTAVHVIESLWATFGPTLLSGIEGVWGPIKTIVSGALTEIQGFFNIFKGLFTGNWNEMWNGLKQVVGGALQQILGVAELQWTMLKTSALLIWDAIGGGIKTALSSIESTASGIWHSISSGLSGLAGDVGHAMGAVASAVSGAASAVLNEAKKIGGDIITGIDTAITAGVQLVTNAIGRIEAAVVAAGAGAIHWLEGVGRDVIQGLVNGIESMAGAVTSAAQKIVDLIPSGIRHFFGIKSPSTLMAEIGTDIMAGLVVGIDSSLGIVNGSLAKMTASTQAQLVAAAPALEAAAKDLGTKTVAGLVNGVIQAQQGSNPFEAALAVPMANHIAEAANSGLIASSSAQFGATAVQKVIDGVEGVMPTLTEKMHAALVKMATDAAAKAAQEVTTATQTFVTAFGTVATNALQAFQTAASSYKSPSQMLLDKMQLQDQAAQYHDAALAAFNKIGSDMAAAQKAAADAAEKEAQLEAADQLAIDKANEAVAAATTQTALDNALDAQTAANAKLLSDQQAYGEATTAASAASQAQQAADTTAMHAAYRAELEYHIGLVAQQQTAAHAAEEAATAAHLNALLGQLQGSLPLQLQEWVKSHAATLGDTNTFSAAQFLAHDTMLATLLDKVKTSLADHPGVWDSTYQNILNTVNGYEGKLYTAGEANADAHKRGIDSQHGATVDVMSGILNDTHDAITGYLDQFFNAGASIGQSVAAGMQSATDAAAAAAANIASQITNHIQLFSPAKKGPLSKPLRWEPLFDGLRSPTLMHDVERHAANLAGAVADGGGPGGIAGGGSSGDIVLMLDREVLGRINRASLRSNVQRNGRLVGVTTTTK